MLVDEQGLISGIIDWGDMNIGHPACDLNVVYSFIPLMHEPVFAAYGDVDEETKRLARLIAVYIPMLIWMQAIDDNDLTVAEEAKQLSHVRLLMRRASRAFSKENKT